MGEILYIRAREKCNATYQHTRTVRHNHIILCTNPFAHYSLCMGKEGNCNMEFVARWPVKALHKSFLLVQTDCISVIPSLEKRLPAGILGSAAHYFCCLAQLGLCYSPASCSIKVVCFLLEIRWIFLFLVKCLSQWSLRPKARSTVPQVNGCLQYHAQQSTVEVRCDHMMTLVYQA